MMTLMLMLALTLSAVSDPPTFAIADQIDLVEVNHYFDDGGKPVFDQLIFYDWDQSAGRYNVVAWRLLKSASQLPLKNAASGKYHACWHDGKVLRMVHADRKQETWTQYDPETYERRFLPKRNRSDLLRVDLKKK